MAESGIAFIEPPQPHERIVGIEMNGELKTEDMRAVLERLQAIVDRGEKVLFYADMRNYDGFELGVVTEKLKHMGLLWKALDKYAIIGDAKWLEIWISICDPLTPHQLKHFHPEKSAEAWAWLLADEANEA